jgi:hypothetical protein
MRLLVASITALIVSACPAGVEAASRLYPFVGVVHRFEFDRERRPEGTTLAQAGAAYSLGRIAPSLTLRANSGRFEAEFGVRFLLRGAD